MGKMALALAGRIGRIKYVNRSSGSVREEGLAHQRERREECGYSICSRRSVQIKVMIAWTLWVRRVFVRRMSANALGRAGVQRRSGAHNASSRPNEVGKKLGGLRWEWSG